MRVLLEFDATYAFGDFQGERTECERGGILGGRAEFRRDIWGTHGHKGDIEGFARNSRFGGVSTQAA